MLKKFDFKSLKEGNYLKINGRHLWDNKIGALMFYFSLSGFEFNFTGNDFKMEFYSTNYDLPLKQGYLSIFIDGVREDFLLDSLNKVFHKSLDNNKHHIKVYKRNEALDSYFGLKSLEITGEILAKPQDKKYLMEVIGASTSCGFGVFGNPESLKSTKNSDALASPMYYAGLKLDCDFLCLNASGWGLTGSYWTNPHEVNLIDAYHALYLGETQDKKTQFVSDLKYDYLHKRKSDIIVLNFGTNDMSYFNIVNDNPYLKSIRIKQYINTYLFLIDFLKSLNKDCKIFLVYGLMKEQPMYKINEEVYQKLEDKKNVYLLKLEGDQLGSGLHPSNVCTKQCGNLLYEAIIKSLSEGEIDG